MCALWLASPSRATTYRDRLAAEGPKGMTDRGLIPIAVRDTTVDVTGCLPPVRSQGRHDLDAPIVGSRSLVRTYLIAAEEDVPVPDHTSLRGNGDGGAGGC